MEVAFAASCRRLARTSSALRAMADVTASTAAAASASRFLHGHVKV